MSMALDIVQQAVIICVVCAATIVGSPAAAQDSDLKIIQRQWADIELMGHHSFSRREILEHIPLEIGTKYKTDREQWKSWSETLEKQFDFFYVKISAVCFVDGKCYLVVDVIEHENQGVIDFRPDPTGDIALPEEVVVRYEKMSTYLHGLFRQGKPPRELSSEGFLDYGEETISKMARELSRMVPGHRDTVLKVLADSSDSRSRATAATLLNWAGDLEKTMLAALPCLRDSSSGVRNNLTRYMLHYFDRVESDGNRRMLIDAIIPQLSLPSHGDRNKAIYAMQMLAASDDATRKYIMEKAGKQIRYIAENSILSNVQIPALEMLDADR